MIGLRLTIVGSAIAVLCAGSPESSVAQIVQSQPAPDSLVRRLASAEWRIRDDAIARLNLLPVEQLPADYAQTVISLFEREAISSHRPGEGYGEYLINLMEGVVRLRDPRSLRGLALLGIEMSREVQEYVASQGAASLPFLDEAWQRGHGSAVATTWAYMLGPYATVLSRPQRHQVMARFLVVASANSRAFTWAAQIGPIPELIPIIEDIEASETQPMRKRGASNALNTLRPLRDAMPAEELSARLEDWVDAMCQNATGKRASSCQGVHDGLRSAQNDARMLDGVVRQLETGTSLNDFERHLIVGNAQHLLGRRP